MALQETHGAPADLNELLKVFPDCWGCGTFAGTVALVARSFLAEATSIIAQPIELGRPLRVVVEFLGGSLNVVAVHSDPAQELGLRRYWLQRALVTRGESPCTLTMLLGDLNVTMPGECRLDVLSDARDFSGASGSRIISATIGNSPLKASAGQAGAMVASGLISAFDHAFCDMAPVDLIDIRPSARLLGRPTDPDAVSDHVPLLVRIPADRGRLAGRRGWPAWVFRTAEFAQTVASLRLSSTGMATDIEYARAMLQAAAARALESCALRPATTDEERLYWGFLSCRAQRRGVSAQSVGHVPLTHYFNIYSIRRGATRATSCASKCARWPMQLRRRVSQCVLTRRTWRYARRAVCICFGCEARRVRGFLLSL